MVKLFVEGGGDAKLLRSACRAGFSNFIDKAGVIRKPRIVACGSRKDAYDSFCIAISQRVEALLLVDSESAVALLHQNGSLDSWKPWDHLRLREGDKWTKPDRATQNDCHLMVHCMENWFLADREALGNFFWSGIQRECIACQRKSDRIYSQKIYL